MKLDTSKICLSEHAFIRMQERFPEQSKTKISATNHVRSLLKSSEYIGVVPDKDDQDSHMFVFNNSVALHLGMDMSRVVTIYQIERTIFGLHHIKEKIAGIYRKEFRKIHRVEQYKRKVLNHTVLENEAEIAALRLRKYKTRSDKVRKWCDDRIAELNSEIWSIKNEVKNIQINKREIAYALATEKF